MTAAAIASSTEAGVLVANHLATARPLTKQARTITSGGTQAPLLVYPQRRRVTAYLSDSNSYPCTRGVLRGSIRQQLISGTAVSSVEVSAATRAPCGVLQEYPVELISFLPCKYPAAIS
ncbi:hypothetical protein AVEN_18506-1 [Araneus ventricosus]|uniref:Uncharacterized protein n=1 Tax=Araneus ventricosus TaxID=182803 RepID=A0A4Y2V2B6_ARAVE|nr:hypothetical protein AVEN_18506-1 [Araneus ventricosus]